MEDVADDVVADVEIDNIPVDSTHQDGVASGGTEGPWEAAFLADVAAHRPCLGANVLHP